MYSVFCNWIHFKSILPNTGCGASKGWDQSLAELQFPFMQKIVECNLMDGLNVTILCSQEAIKLLQPVLLGYLLRFFETYDPNDSHGLELAYYYALSMSLCLFGLVVAHHMLFFNNQKAGMKIRVAMCNVIYRKVSLLDGLGGSGCGLKRGLLFTCSW